MHEVKVKGILSPKNGMNIYRGCTHGCIYCDSRSKCYGFTHPFCDIEIKSNALELLEQALRKKRKKCMIGTGSMSDPYMPIEESLCHMRSALKLIEKYGHGVSVITKSDLILRDLDLLTAINKRAKTVVQMTMTTFDEELCQILEPNVATTRRRFEVLKILRDNNIPTVVWLCPILPFINDTEDNINGILSYCTFAKVSGILCFNMGLTLRAGNREYFYDKLDEHFPGLKEKYIRTYKNSYEVTSPNNDRLMSIFRQTCKENDILCDIDEVFAFINTLDQKSGQTQLDIFNI